VTNELQIIPAWVSELAKAHNRGSAFALVFCANYVGIVIAYWLGYGLRNDTTAFRWRFPLAFQLVPIIILLCTVWFLPESPRWLISQGRREEAVEILAKIRGDVPLNDPELVQELEQLDAVVVSSNHKRYKFHNVTFGRYSGKLHLGRRVCLAIGIMMMMEWTGILAITVYANTLFQTAGFTVEKASWLSGLCNTFGILGTVASIFTVDRFGRRISLYFGFFIQGAVLFLSAGLGRLGELNPDQAGAYGAAAAAMVFIYTFFFAQTVLMIAFIYPTEIWPQEIRAFGNSYGVFGWAIGCGVTTLVIPSMFSTLQWKTLIVFASFNFLSLPLVYFFFPETRGRTLEEVNLLFAAESPLVSANEAEYRRLLEAADGNVALAERRMMDEVDSGNVSPDDVEKHVGGKIDN
jgi:MFS family permease